MFAKLLTLFSVAALLAFCANAQKVTKTPKEEQCSVSGMVVKMAGSAPLRKAHLLLQSQEDKTRRLAAVTNDDGRFVIKGVEPGGYRLSVSRLGFVTEEYGQRKPEAPGATLTLRPGQELKDLLFRLVPSAVISGKILDEDGERCRRFQYLPSSRVTRKESESFLARTGRKPMISANTAFTVLRQVDIS